MENRNIETSFKYTYSAKEQDEIAKIRKKYQVQEEDGMSRLRKLDAGVSQKASVVSLIMGITGALIMGTGMSLILTEVGAAIGLHGAMGMVVGIIFGVIGIIPVAMAYPVYNRVLKKERERVAPEILRLTEELMRE